MLIVRANRFIFSTALFVNRKFTFQQPSAHFATYRIEKDSLGDIKVPSDKYWGAQTQRSLESFDIGDEHDRMPDPLIKAFGILNKCAARVNREFGLSAEYATAIEKVCDEIIEGKLISHFPLGVWQTGNGIQFNTNCNEVIENRVIEIMGGKIGEESRHVNNCVSKNQSSYDSFPTAMRIATVLETHNILLPGLKKLHQAFAAKSQEYTIEIGRPNEPNPPYTALGQEYNRYTTQVEEGIRRIEQALSDVYYLPQHLISGPGIKTCIEFPEKLAFYVEKETGFPFKAPCDKMEFLDSYAAVINYSSALNTLAESLLKIAHDIRLSGKVLKVKDTHYEAITMVCAQVI